MATSGSKSAQPNIFVSWGVAGKCLETFKEFPPVQKPNTFTIDQAMERMAAAASGG